MKKLICFIILLFLVISAGCSLINTSLITSINGQGYIEVNPNKRDHFNIWDKARLTAIPDTGWEFVYWSGDIDSNQNPIEIDMIFSKSVIANFSCIGTNPTLTGPLVDFIGKGAFIFLSKTGNDSNNGLSKETPVKTLSKAFSIAQYAKDPILVFDAGHYMLTSDFRFNKSLIMIGGLNRTFSNYDLEPTLLDFQQHSISITGDHLEFHKMEYINGRQIEIEAKKIVMSECLFRNFNTDEHHGVVNINFHDNTDDNESVYGFNDWVEIQHCTFAENNTYYGVLSSIASTNYIHNNCFVNNTNSASRTDIPVGVDLGWGYGYEKTYGIIYNNTFINDKAGASIHHRASNRAPQSAIFNNIFYNCFDPYYGADSYISHNCFYPNLNVNANEAIDAVFVNPEITIYDNYDVVIDNYSPLIDTGFPLVFEKDGTRSDIGHEAQIAEVKDFLPPQITDFYPPDNATHIPTTSSVSVLVKDFSHSECVSLKINQQEQNFSIEPVTYGGNLYRIIWNENNDTLLPGGEKITVNITCEDSYGNIENTQFSFYTAEGNRFPYIPNNPVPFDGFDSKSVNGNLYWGDGEYDLDDPDSGDVVSFQIFLDANKSNPTTLISEGENAHNRVYVHDLLPNTTYYWQVVAKDLAGATTKGPIWSFTTEAAPASMSSHLDYLGLIDLNDSDFSGIAFDGNYLWFSKESDRVLQKRSSNFNIITEYSFPNPEADYSNPTDLSWDQTINRVAACLLGYSGKKYTFDPLNETFNEIERSYVTEGLAVTKNGDYLVGSSWIGQIQNTEHPMERDELYDFGWQKDINGLHHDGTNLWVSVNNILYCCSYELDSTGQVIDITPTYEYSIPYTIADMVNIDTTLYLLRRDGFIEKYGISYFYK